MHALVSALHQFAVSRHRSFRSIEFVEAGCMAFPDVHPSAGGMPALTLESQRLGKPMLLPSFEFITSSEFPVNPMVRSARMHSYRRGRISKSLRVNPVFACTPVKVDRGKP